MKNFNQLDVSAEESPWPELVFAEWKETYVTLHLWTQIVGKIRLGQMPWINHSWHTTLYPTVRGLTTSPMPYGTRIFQIDFDFIEHQLLVQTNEGQVERMALKPRSVAQFYQELFEKLWGLGLEIKIHKSPNELPTAIPFDEDHEHAAYDAAYANRLWRALLQAERVFRQFRARFIGKCSPVHFFWGGFDLAVTRFSGRKAPLHPGGVPHLADWITREAYSREVSSCGFWPGSEQLPQAVFYAYAYPQPEGFSEAEIRPQEAAYNAQFREFILPYEAVRQSSSPDEKLLEFLQSSYEAAANLAGWNRAALEQEQPLVPVVERHTLV